MKLPQKSLLHLELEISAGGRVHIPPAGCLPPACASACIERTGWAVTKKWDGMGTVETCGCKWPDFVMGLMP